MKTLSLGLGIVLILGLSLAGCGPKAEPAPTEPTPIPPVVELKPSFSPAVALSADQGMLVDAFGYPTDFFIFVNEESGVRFEVWQYSDLLQSFSFENGVFQNMTKMTTGGSPVETEWKPTHFPSDFDRAWIEACLGAPDDVLEWELVIGKVETLIYENQLLVSLLDGEAYGVQTMFSVALTEQYLVP